MVTVCTRSLVVLTNVLCKSNFVTRLVIACQNIEGEGEYIAPLHLAWPSKSHGTDWRMMYPASRNLNYSTKDWEVLRQHL